jgi:hypothetical protein
LTHMKRRYKKRLKTHIHWCIWVWKLGNGTKKMKGAYLILSSSASTSAWKCYWIFPSSHCKEALVFLGWSTKLCDNTFAVGKREKCEEKEMNGKSWRNVKKDTKDGKKKGRGSRVSDIIKCNGGRIIFFFTMF